MLRVSFATLRRNTARYVTTVLAILLGVTFVVGTLVFSDTLRASFDHQLMGSAGSMSVVVHSQDDEGVRDDLPLEPDLLRRIGALPEVKEVGGMVSDHAAVLDQAGRPLGFMPPAAVSLDDVARFEAGEGRLPEGDDEVALAASTAELAGFAIGDTVTVVDGEGDTHDLTVTGLVDFGVESPYALDGAAVYTEDALRSLTGVSGYHELDVLAAEGYSDEEAAEAVRAVAGDGALVRTGEEFARALAEAAGADARLIRVGLLLFGLVSVFVGGIVIYNTFAILIAQRQRDLALLRCVGVGRGQVFRGVLVESVVVGLVASALGTAAGIGAGAAAMGAAAPAFAVEPGAISLAVGPAAVVVGLVLGTAMAVISALVPAVRATRVAPLEALRGSATATGISERVGAARPLFAGLLFVASAVVTALAVSGPIGVGPLIAVVVAGILAFLGVAVLGPVIVRGAAVLAGVMLRWAGVAGRLAVDNTRRSPRRAATAMIALTVGATLITGYSVVSASLEATSTEKLDEQFPVDYQISPQMQPGAGDPAEDGDESDQAVGVPAEVYTSLGESPVIDHVFAARQLPRGEETSSIPVNTFVDAELGEDIALDVDAGDLAELGPGRIVLSEGFADGAGPGDTFTVGTAEQELDLEVVAIIDNMQAFGGALLDPQDFARAFPDAEAYSAVFVQADDEADPADVREAVYSAVEDHPLLQVGSTAEIRGELEESLRTALLIIAGMLGLAVVIALIGIANTLTLSVIQRTRESALLRALGLARRSLRGMLGLEAILLATVGTVVGVTLGVVFGWAVGSTVLSGLLFTVPYGQVAAFVAAGVLAGLLASVLPGRRAAQASITDALGAQ
jgi:putative ABC transport system permease protein